ncbi:MAG: hypothetical protein AB1540_10790 [Bdellovibrionota bacterium]
MSEIKVLLYKENNTPRSIALSTGMIYRTLIAACIFGILILLSVALAAKYYVLNRAKMSHSLATEVTSSDREIGPSNSTEDQVRTLRDQVDQLNAQLINANATKAAPRELDKKNPALALFTPIITDHAQKQEQVTIGNFRYSKTNGKSPATLTFELHNAHPGETTEKGYIVVLARTDNALHAYPNAFSTTAPYLLDFEKGETFQVARFRLVNAQFNVDAQRFQVLIFTRKGELLINMLHEVKSSGS